MLADVGQGLLHDPVRVPPERARRAIGLPPAQVWETAELMRTTSHQLFDRDQPWPLMDGVVTCMLVALSLLALLDVRYPLRVLPVLLFELGWKMIRLSIVAAPLRAAGRMDAATEGIFWECALVVIIAAVIPWRYVITAYARKPAITGVHVRSIRRAGSTPTHECRLIDLRQR